MTDRARVPFALVGVLLLVTSGTVAVSNTGPAPREPAADQAMDGLAAESQSALRSAVRLAARESAKRPVIEPANSTVGEQLRSDAPFRDALRLRIYRRAANHLERVSGRTRGLAVSASLPPIEDSAAVRQAIDRVRVEAVGSAGTSIEVTITGIRLEARQDGQVVGRATRNLTIAVRTPVLHVHRRVSGFERRLNATVGRAGLATYLTAVLYPVAWARGYAQFAGRPIENVVANRHVAVVTNGAVLRLQRSAFGQADPLGRRVYGRALAETLATDAVEAANSSTLDRLQRLRERSGHAESGADSLDRLRPPADAPSPSDSMTVGINRTADVAYVRALRRLNDTLDTLYSPAVRVRADVSRLERETSRRGSAGRNLIRSYTITSTSVENRSGTPPRAADGWHRFAGHSRTVTVTERTYRRWEKPGNETTTTLRTVRTTYAVELLVAGRHHVGPAPMRHIETVHERGGPFEGPNFADVRSLAREHVADRGGIDELATRAARGELDTGTHHVQADRPGALATWARPDLTKLRHRIRNVSVEVEGRRVAAFEANVPGLLAERLRDRRSALVDAPETYSSVAQRARVGVRAAYVDSVLDRLDAAASAHDSGREGLGDALSDTDRPPSDMLSAGRPATDGWAGSAGPAVPMRVDAAPSYLTLEAVDHESVPAVDPGRTEHPLVARNVNAFSVPTDGVVEFLFGLLEGPKKTSLRSGAQVLRAVAATTNATDGRRMARTLRSDMQQAVDGYRAWTESTLADHDLGTPRSRTDAVNAALDRWSSPGARAAAMSNGSAPAAVLQEALDRWPNALDDRHEREVLAIALDTAAIEARSADFLQPEAGTVNETATRVREALGVVGDRVRSRAKSIAKKKAASIAASLPSGVPVVPAPGLWYAMVNAWHVEVRGSYARFAVSVPRGAPDRLPADFRYVRENATVTLDVDGDGTPERLGWNRRIRFEAETVVAVAVPPKPRGVGDVGERDEQSAGWPSPGPAEK